MSNSKNRVQILKRTFLRGSKGVKVPYAEGNFCEWSMDSNEGPNGPAHFPVAIVKMDDGSIKAVYCELIKFINP